MQQDLPGRRRGSGAALGAALLFSSVALASPPVPDGPFRAVCDPCTVTPVGDVGLMLGCMCGRGDHQVPTSLYLRGGDCDAGITFSDGELRCGAAPEPQAQTPRRSDLPDTAVALADAPASPPSGPARVPGASELTASRLRLAALGAVPASARSTTVPTTDLLSVDAWNASGNPTIRLAPMDCVVTEEGVMACMCPRTLGLPASPSVDHLQGEPSAWTCGCTEKAGLVCVPEP